MVSNKTWRNRIKNANNPIIEYAKCLCPSCYVLNCENRKKPAVIGGVKKGETHFEKLDSF